MSCPFHHDKTPSFSIVDKGNGAFYKCFSCNEGGDIIKFIQKTENLPFIQALQKAYEILNRPLNLPNIKTNTKNYLNKENLKNFYNDKYEKNNKLFSLIVCVYEKNNIPLQREKQKTLFDRLKKKMLESCHFQASEINL